MTPECAQEQPSGFLNHLEKIAIVGAGGRVGMPITQALLQTGKHTVTAITRAGSTSELPQGVVAAEVDYDSEKSLVEALKGQHCLVITLSIRAAPNTQSQLVQAAAKAGVPYVMPNLWGYDSRRGMFQDLGPMATAFARICDEIESLGVSKWLGINNGFWYEFSLGGTPDRFGFDFQTRSLTLIDDGNTRINTTTFSQVGRAVAALLSLKIRPEEDGTNGSSSSSHHHHHHHHTPTISQWDNDVVAVSSFRISQRDMFASVQRVTGTTDADWTVGHEHHRERYDQALQGMRKGDVPAFVRTLYTRVFFPDGAGDYEGTGGGTANGVLGLPQEALDEATQVGVERGLAGVL